MTVVALRGGGVSLALDAAVAPSLVPEPAAAWRGRPGLAGWSPADPAAPSRAFRLQGVEEREGAGVQLPMLAPEQALVLRLTAT